MLDTMLAKVGSLETFPERGAVPPELAALGIREFRQIVAPPYRLICRVVGAVGYVSVVADGRRDLQSLLERRLLR